MQQQHDFLYLPAVLLGPGGGKGQRQAGAPLQVDDEARLVAVLFQGPEVGVGQPDVLDAGRRDRLPIGAHPLQRPLVHLAADRPGAPLAEGAFEGTAATGFIGDGVVQRAPPGVGELQRVQRRGKAVQVLAAGPGRRGDLPAALQVGQAIHRGPLIAIPAVQKLLEALFRLPQEHHIDGIDPEVVAGLLYVRSPGYYQQFRQSLLELPCQRQELCRVPGIDAETRHGRQARGYGLPGPRQFAVLPVRQPGIDVVPAMKVDQPDVGGVSAATVLAKIGCQGSGGGGRRIELL